MFVHMQTNCIYLGRLMATFISLPIPCTHALAAPPLPLLQHADKRAHHNALERKRRDHIKDSFHHLRDTVPHLEGEKVSSVCVCVCVCACMCSCTHVRECVWYHV